jgi:hypothetical protein
MTTLTPVGRDSAGRFRRLADIERAKVRQAMRAQADMMKADFEKTTATWSHKPLFTITELEGGTRYTVGTTDEIYKFVSGGTRPHIIRARNAKVLAFKSAYQAKTRVRVIGSGPGGSSGENVYRREVQHPGTEARDFERTIQFESQRTIANNVQRAITQGVREAGL